MTTNHSIQLIDAVNAELAKLSAEEKSSTAAGVKAGLSRLFKLEQSLIAAISDSKSTTAADKVAYKDAMERVSEAIARLIELASDFAPPPLAPAVASPIVSRAVVSRPPPSPTAQEATGTPQSPTSRRAAQPPIPPPKRTAAAFMEGPPEISPDEITLGAKIGEGAYGKVYRGTCRGKEVAVKVPNKQTLTDHELMLFRREVTIMRKVFHPNVVLFLGASMAPGKPIMIVTELMRGDVETLLHPTEKGVTPPEVSLYQRLRMAYDAALGINWLHGICSIVHRDLKPANLLLDENNHIKVTDFGFSEVLRGHGKDAKNPKGTALYMAPEVMRCEEFDLSSDVHSFGIILWEMLTGREPFEQFTEIEPFVQAVCFDNVRPEIPANSNIPEIVVDLMRKCWDPTPSVRPSFPAIITTLETAMVQVAMSNAVPRLFWKRHFTNPFQERVPIATLASVISSESGLPMAAITGISRLLMGTGKPSGDNVTMERFNQLYSWFGDWYGRNGGSALRLMASLQNQPWFHEDITMEVANSRLAMRASGTFLVRLSFKDPRTPFTLSSTVYNKAQHRRIYHMTQEQDGVECYAIQTDDGTGTPQFIKFDTLVELIENLRKGHYITDACPRDRLEVVYA